MVFAAIFFSRLQFKIFKDIMAEVMILSLRRYIIFSFNCFKYFSKALYGLLANESEGMNFIGRENGLFNKAGGELKWRQ